MKKLPIGIQDFAKIRQEDYLYVDKTQYLHRLMTSGSYFFFSRPRRFGKSLLISTLRELFLGHQELFSGLWIEDKIDWQTYPVILIDMNALNYHSNALEEELNRRMAVIAQEYNLILEATDYKNRFTELLQKLSTEEHRCVVLIDEYDKPITDHLEEPAKAAEHVKVLKNFYSTLKSQDRFIHFAFLTGVSRYGKVSIFSDLNNLFDLSMNHEYLNMAGYTPAELSEYFGKYLEGVSEQMEIPLPELLDKVQYWYNGYSWDGKQSVYNPFSILSFLQADSFQNFWFTTGTPTFLTQQLKEEQTAAYELVNLSASDTLLASGDLEHVDIVALLFQTGYLTVKAVTRLPSGQPSYTLGFPNQEVAISFQQYLLAEYLQAPVNKVSRLYTTPLINALLVPDWETFFDLVQSVFSSIPYSLFVKQEKYFHSIMHVLLGTTGMQVHSEVQTNKGRMDAVVAIPNQIIIFEFKIDQTAAIALEQIKEKGYPERFRQPDHSIILIGVNFSTEERNVSEWGVEEG